MCSTLMTACGRPLLERYAGRVGLQAHHLNCSNSEVYVVLEDDNSDNNNNDGGGGRTGSNGSDGSNTTHTPSCSRIDPNYTPCNPGRVYDYKGVCQPYNPALAPASGGKSFAYVSPNSHLHFV